MPPVEFSTMITLGGTTVAAPPPYWLWQDMPGCPTTVPPLASHRPLMKVALYESGRTVPAGDMVTVKGGVVAGMFHSHAIPPPCCTFTVFGLPGFPGDGNTISTIIGKKP